MSNRLGVRELVADQFGTMHSSGQTKLNLGDVALYFIAPLAAGVAAWLAGARFHAVSELIAGTTLLSGLLFALLVHVFTLRLRLVDTARYSPSSPVAVFIDELRANVSYACAVCLVFTATLVVTAVDAGQRIDKFGAHPVLSGVITTLGIHLFLILLMVIKRLRTAYKLLS